MGRSFYRPKPENIVEDYTRRNTFYHRASDRYYTMYRRDGRYYQRRHQIGFDGTETNIVEKEIHFVMGSGNHTRTYLHLAPGGRLLEMPVAWYSEKGGFWAMNPGYDRPDHADFRRRVIYECMFCHNGYPEIERGADASGSDPLFLGKIPEGIDCQRCHGPGRDHIQAVESGGATLEKIRQAILNPARLTAERQLELCMQCHLETTSFRLPHSLRRFPRGVFSYRPGEPLADYILHFDHPPGTGHDDKFEIVNAVYRLRKSACFQKSAGRMTCTTCHNPHDVPRGAAALRHYTQVCRGCHGASLEKLVAAGRHTGAPESGSPESGAPDCLGCHMPKRRTEDVVHVVMTDHLIQRRKPARDLLAPLQERHDTPETAYRGQVILYYPPQLPPAPENELDQAAAQVKQNTNLRGGIPRLERAIQKHRPPRVEYYFELAEAYWNSGEAGRAFAMYEEALRRKPDFWPALHNFGSALARSGQTSRAIEILQRAVTVAPHDALALAHLGLAYVQQNQPGDAVRVLSRALEIDADLPEAHNNLGGALLEQGDRAGAEAAFRNAFRVRPDFSEAHKNLADLLLRAGDLRQAQYHLDQAIQHDAKYAEAYNALGELLAIKGDIPRAAEQFRKAIQCKSELASAHFNLGAALMAMGKRSQARQHLRNALQRDPQHHEAHLNLGKLLAAEGNFPEARLHLEKGAQSPDPQIRQAALESLKTARPRP